LKKVEYREISGIRHGIVRSALFWDVTHRWLLLSYLCCGMAYRSLHQGSSSPRRMRNIPEEPPP